MEIALSQAFASAIPDGVVDFAACRQNAQTPAAAVTELAKTDLVHAMLASVVLHA
jgi:hypothetical protein